MKTLTYSITINKPVDAVFNTMIDKSTYPQWAKAWGEGMTFAGEWKAGEHISFFDQTQGGTKAVVEEIIPNECVKTKHVGMVNPENIEIELTDDMMRKWIGTQEDYFFSEVSDSETEVKVVMIADEAFAEMMEAWHDALRYLKEICENT